MLFRSYMSSTLANGEIERPASSHRTLLALIGLTIAPVAASYFTYYVVKPARPHTVGELLQIQPLPTLPAIDQNGAPVDLGALKGKWLLLTSTGKECGPACRKNLFTMQQLRLAQGREKHRVERLLLTAQPLAPVQGEGAQGMHVWHDSGQLAQRLPVSESHDASHFFYVIDPLGNQVLRYRDDTDPGAMIREIGKLLKNNQGLG